MMVIAILNLLIVKNEIAKVVSINMQNDYQFAANE